MTRSFHANSSGRPVCHFRHVSPFRCLTCFLNNNLSKGPIPSTQTPHPRIQSRAEAAKAPRASAARCMRSWCLHTFSAAPSSSQCHCYRRGRKVTLIITHIVCRKNPFWVRTVLCGPRVTSRRVAEATAGAYGAKSRAPRTSPVSSSDAETFMSTGVKAVPLGTQAASNHFLYNLRKSVEKHKRPDFPILGSTFGSSSETAISALSRTQASEDS